MPNPIDDLIGGFVKDLADIFLKPGQEGGRQHFNLLMRMQSPDITDPQVFALFAIMFGLGLLIALLIGAFGAARAAWGTNWYKFLNNLALFVKEYIFGTIIFPLVFGLLYIVSIQGNDTLASTLNLTEHSINNATSYDFADAALNFISSIALIPMTMLFGMEVVFTSWFLPLIVWVIGPAIYPLSGGKPNSKLMAWYWGVTLMAIFSLFAMRLVAGLSIKIQEYFLAANQGFDALIIVGSNYAILFFVMVTPLILGIITRKAGDEISKKTALHLEREQQRSESYVRTADQIRAQQPGKSDNSGIGLLPIATIAVAGAAVGHATKARETEGPEGNRTAAIATFMAGISKAAGEAAKKKGATAAAATFAAPVATAAWATSLVAERRASKATNRR